MQVFRSLTVVNIVALLLLTLSCSRQTSAPVQTAQQRQSLTELNWTLRELPGSKPYLGKSPTLDFTSDPPRVMGFAGCNSFSGAYMLTGTDSLLFGAAAISERMCTTENPERVFLAMMKRTNRYTISDHELRLYHGAELLAVFNGEAPESEEAHAHETVILDGSWELEYIAAGESFESLFPNAIPFMTIDTQTGKSGGSNGCNGYSASFVLKGNLIRFRDPIATKMACPGNGEQAFFKNLLEVDNFTMQNDLLHLRKGEEVRMRFHRKH